MKTFEEVFKIPNKIKTIKLNETLYQNRVEKEENSKSVASQGHEHFHEGGSHDNEHEHDH